MDICKDRAFLSLCIAPGDYIIYSIDHRFVCVLVSSLIGGRPTFWLRVNRLKYFMCMVSGALFSTLAELVGSPVVIG